MLGEIASVDAAGQVTLRVSDCCGELESTKLRMMLRWMLLTVVDPPAALMIVGLMLGLPGSCGVALTLYGGVPPVTTNW